MSRPGLSPPGYAAAAAAEAASHYYSQAATPHPHPPPHTKPTWNRSTLAFRWGKGPQALRGGEAKQSNNAALGMQAQAHAAYPQQAYDQTQAYAQQAQQTAGPCGLIQRLR